MDQGVNLGKCLCPAARVCHGKTFDRLTAEALVIVSGRIWSSALAFRPRPLHKDEGQRGRRPKPGLSPCKPRIQTGPQVTGVLAAASFPALCIFPSRPELSPALRGSEAGRYEGCGAHMGTRVRALCIVTQPGLSGRPHPSGGCRGQVTAPTIFGSTFMGLTENNEGRAARGAQGSCDLFLALNQLCGLARRRVRLWVCSLSQLL